MEQYFIVYHDYYSEILDKHRDQLFIAPHEIHACKNLTLELLRSMEGKSPKLTMPLEEGLDALLQLINNVDDMIHMNVENKTTLFGMMRDFLSDNRSNPYRDHCFRIASELRLLYPLF